jgi:diaminopimelate decarboxylase
MIFIKPIIHNFWINFINDYFYKERLSNKDLNSFHLLNLNIIDENIEKIKNFFLKNNLSYDLYYSFKANKSEMIVKYLSEKGIGIETSSEKELEKAKKFSQKIICQGPKNDTYLKLIQKNNQTINVVNDNEELIKSIRMKIKNIIIRIGNLKNNNFVENYTHFGLDEDEIENTIKTIKNNEKYINFLGFSFHLDTTSDDLKIIYLSKAIYFLIKAKMIGLKPKYLNIGGGWRVNYMGKKEWEKIINFIYEKINQNNNQYFWNNHNFGITKINDRLFGEGSFYHFYDEISEEKQLEKIINSHNVFLNENNLKILKDLSIKIIVESGRFLLNQTGISVFKIFNVVKNKIFVDGKATDIAHNLDILYDPILVKNNKEKSNYQNNDGYFIFGKSCLEDDIFFKRKIFFEKLPQKDDFLIFINTTSYKQDIFANEFITHSQLKKYFVNNFNQIKNDI